MKREEAYNILTKNLDRVSVNIIKGNDEKTQKYNAESIEAFNMALEALKNSYNSERERKKYRIL